MRVERRIALVVGNGAYGPRIGPLDNPTHDASDIAAALRSLGFEVALALDVDTGPDAARDDRLRQGAAAMAGSACSTTPATLSSCTGSTT